MTKREKIAEELERVKDAYRTEHDDHELYWRGVRIGLETALNILDDPDYKWFANSSSNK